MTPEAFGLDGTQKFSRIPLKVFIPIYLLYFIDHYILYHSNLCFRNTSSPLFYFVGYIA